MKEEKLLVPDKFGCEFEFILKNKNNEILLLEELNESFDICVKHTPDKNKIEDEDEYKCMHFKAEESLKNDLGREITTPISNLEDLTKYIVDISAIIQKYAYTNEDCGFHVHMSESTTAKDLNFGLFALIAENSNLLNQWGNRNNYALNLTDIFNALSIEDALVFKESKGRVWNMLHRGHAWVEVRTMGGTDYEMKHIKLIENVNSLVKVFTDSYNPQNKVKYLDYIEKHIDRISTLEQKVIEKYLMNFPEIESYIDIDKLIEHVSWNK